MLLKTFETCFIINGFILFFAIITFKLCIKNSKNHKLLSNYVATLTFFMLFYVVLGLFATLLSPNFYNKLIMFAFATSPFIIGKFATYKTEQAFSAIQVFTIWVSIMYVL